MEVDVPTSGRVSLAIVMPVYNEMSTITEVFEEWCSAVELLGEAFRFFLVDDGSTDGTAAVLDKLQANRKENVCVIRQPNQGHGRACRTGYVAAIESGAAYVLQVDSDGQCDPAHLPRFWALRAEVDCVFGRRVKRDDGWMRYAISRVCSTAVGIIVGHQLVDVNVPYRLVRGEILQQALSRIPEQFDMQNVALTVTLAQTPGVRFAHVPIRFRSRVGGESTLNIRRIGTLGGNMLRQLRWLKN